MYIIGFVNGKLSFQQCSTPKTTRHRIFYYSGSYSRVPRILHGSQTMKNTNNPSDRMRYHALMINLCCDNFGSYSSFATQDKRVPMNLDPGKGYSALEVAISSARQISIVVQMMRTAYGMRYVHQFAMYAVNVAIYVLLEQPSFDILDPDFLHLTGAFSAISSRSQVGKSLYHFFKLSVRSRDSGHKLDTLDEIPAELKEIFAQVRQVDEAEKPGYDKNSQHTLKDHPQSVPSPGLKDMIGEYEKLSVGKEERSFDQWESADFDF